MERQNSHFKHFADWPAVSGEVSFTPRRPAYTAGCSLSSIAVHVMNHRMQQLAIGERSLEAHYESFVIHQKQANSHAAAKEQAFSRSYGEDPESVLVAGHEAYSYALGPVPKPDDIDGRTPAVVVWPDGDMVYLVASEQLNARVLQRIATSMYE